jgi:signal transduction histidine kinase/ligand-binding sensor domain-containing protein/ActR/RegA family two-component response regulator
MTKRPKSIQTIAIWFLLSASALYAQRYNFKFYGEEEGLQSLAVQVVLQDRAGFLWVGSQNGLYRYDGNRFTGFGKTDGLPDAHIESLHESIDGTLWVGTRFGLARRKKDRFEKVEIGAPDGIVGRQGIASDASGRLYVATEHGLVVGTPTGKDFAFGLLPNPAKASAPIATSVYVDAKGLVWFGCGTSLCILDHEHTRELGTELGLPRDRWDAILGDFEGNLWVRSEKYLFERVSGGRFILQNGLPESPNTYPTLALDPAGRLLAPTYEGLARQTESGWEVITAKDGLDSNDISAVMQDREGSIWIGLLGSGLARWLGYNEWQSWGEREGLSRESIWAITRDGTGRLWVGTQFGLNYAENVGGKLLWRKQAAVDAGFVRTLASAPDGTLWIGTDPGGLLALNVKTGAVRKIGEAQGLKNIKVRHIALDHEGRLWVATYGGLFRSIPGNNTQFEQLSPPGTDAEEIFHSILVDRDGLVFVAGDRGLVRYADDRVRRFTKKDGLAYDKIAQVIEDPDGSLWIGYRDAYGITHVKFPGGERNDELKLESVTQANGLRSDKTLFLQFDARGWLWVGTDHGVDVFDHSRWRHYGRSAGLIWDDCNSKAFFADSDGSVWIGTSRGLSRFRPTSSPPASVPPPVVFTSAKFGEKIVEPTHSLEVPYQENSLQVRFAALTFAQESNVLFRYRLEGITRDWLETTERELNYPKLPPGQYSLEVMARNAQGLWSAEPARLVFQVMTPWWQTSWFRIASVLLALALGRLMWLRRTQRLEAERFRLEKAVTDRTRELSQEKQRVVEEKLRVEQQNREIERLLTEAQQASRLKSEFLANMSHEIRTPMNGVLGMTDLVLATPLSAEQRDYLQTARLSANSLLTILNDVLDFSKIEAGRLELNPILFALRQSVAETCKMLRVGAVEKGLVLECHVGATVPDQLMGDPDRLRQTLFNLIGNAIKFTESGGVYLTVEDEGCADGFATVRFTVRDTGIGIALEKQQLIFEAFRQADGSTTRKYGGTGLGLAICSRLVEMMGGTIHVKSEVGGGSTFSFAVRYGIPAPPIATEPTHSASLQNLLEGASHNGTPPRLRILLAEDNPINQRLAMRLLERRGHSVDLAETGREAIELSARINFDLILMDLQMPDMDGLEATALIRQREKQLGIHTPIVALTAYTMPGDRERCLEAGMDNYINKPIDAAKFLEIVEWSAATSGV